MRSPVPQEIAFDTAEPSKRHYELRILNQQKRTNHYWSANAMSAERLCAELARLAD
jgi:hypothetical protein